MAIGMAVLALLVLLVQQASAGEFNRVPGDKCEGCMIVHGVGFNSFKDDVVKDCTCYYHCTIDMDNRDMVAYKMCCPCGMGWSQKLCECVKVKHPLSDCVQNDDYNPCNDIGVEDGNLLPRYDPERADPHNELMCKGYFECRAVPGQADLLVPVAKCCGIGHIHNAF
ncbi:uncharacterized protein LOC128225943 [Mya arenaria]|uniref:uncharacterized protein LOC128225943 n=1 Tax=Mya arenaria TaxID=6604 RepID=UPI0022E51B17|nr:uncharacterized protein LOC128225943 [Mya arenaria]